MKSNTKSENVQNISTQLIYISSAQQPHTASGYHVGWDRSNAATLW
jgi:hypothetical protein